MQVINLLTASANGSGTAYDNDGRRDTTVSGASQVSNLTARHIVFTVVSADATCTVEFSLDGSTWYTLKVTVDTTETYSISEAYPYLRATVSSYGSGTVTVDMALHYGA